MSAFGSKDSKKSFSLNNSVHCSYQDLQYWPLSGRLKTERLLTLSHKTYRSNEIPVINTFFVQHTFLKKICRSSS